MKTAEDVLRSLPLPPKNLLGKDDKVIKALVETWVENCAGQCATAALTQEEINSLFLSWLKRNRTNNYTDLVINHLIKRLIKTPRPKRAVEANDEIKARRVVNAASKLRGPLAVITGGQIIEYGKEAGNTMLSLVDTWKSRGEKPRAVINAIVEDIQNKLLLADQRNTNPSADDPLGLNDAAE